MKYINNRYFYSFLSLKEKQLYELLFDGINQRRTRFSFNMSGVNVDNLIDALFCDCPELFNVKSWDMTYTDREIWFSERNPFLYSPIEEKEIKNRLDDIVLSFPLGQDGFMKELSVHNYLVRACKFDRDYSSRAAGSKEEHENHSMIGPLIHGLGVCSGISRAAQYLLMRLEVPVIYCTGRISGAAESEGHAWLIVKIQNQYYHLDVSHDVCLSENMTVPRYSYFNVTDSDISQDHIIDKNKYSRLSCNSNLLNYYQRYNRYYTNRAQIKNSVKKFINDAYPLETKRRIDFRVASNITEDDVNAIMVDIMNTTDRALGFSFSGGALNTYSVLFSLNSIQ